MNPVSGSIPFASLSGSQQVVRSAAGAAARASYGGGTGPVGRIGPVAPAKTIEPTSEQTPSIPSSPTADTDRLVGARVSRGIDFEVGGAGGANLSAVGVAVRSPASRPAGLDSAFQMYRHPADRHAAATAVNVGRSIDVTG